MVKVTPRIASRSMPRTRYASLRPVIASAGICWLPFVMSALQRLVETVGHKVDSHHQAGDRQRWEQDWPPEAANQERVLLEDREPPVRRGRLDAEADEGQRGRRKDRVAETDGEFDQDRAQYVGQDLDEHHVGSPLLPQLGGLDVLEAGFGEDGSTHRASD